MKRRNPNLSDFSQFGSNGLHAFYRTGALGVPGWGRHALSATIVAINFIIGHSTYPKEIGYSGYISTIRLAEMPSSCPKWIVECLS